MLQTAIGGFLVLFVSLVLHNRCKAKLSDGDLLYFERKVKPRFLRYYYFAVVSIVLTFLFGLQFNTLILPSPVLLGLILYFDTMAIYILFSLLKGSSAELGELKFTLSGLILGQLILLSLFLYMTA